MGHGSWAIRTKTADGCGNGKNSPLYLTLAILLTFLTYHCKRGEGEEDGLRVRPLVGWLLVGPVDAAAAQVKPRLGGDGHHLVHLMRVNRF